MALDCSYGSKSLFLLTRCEILEKETNVRAGTSMRSSERTFKSMSRVPSGDVRFTEELPATGFTASKSQHLQSTRAYRPTPLTLSSIPHSWGYVVIGDDGYLSGLGRHALPISPSNRSWMTILDPARELESPANDAVHASRNVTASLSVRIARMLKSNVYNLLLRLKSGTGKSRAFQL